MSGCGLSEKEHVIVDAGVPREQLEAEIAALRAEVERLKDEERKDKANVRRLHALNETFVGIEQRAEVAEAARDAAIREIGETARKQGEAEAHAAQWEQTATTLLARAETAEAELAMLRKWRDEVLVLPPYEEVRDSSVFVQALAALSRAGKTDLAKAAMGALDRLKTTLDEKGRSLRQAEAERDKYQAGLHDHTVLLLAAEARAERLAQYERHHRNCRAWGEVPGTATCDCGLAEALRG